MTICALLLFSGAFSLSPSAVLRMRLLLYLLSVRAHWLQPLLIPGMEQTVAVHGLETLLSQPLLLLDVAKNKTFVPLNPFCLSSLTAGTFSAVQEALTAISC